MKTHITTLNNMAGTASLAHRRVLKVAQSIGCHEMGLSFYPLKPDYAKEIDKRLDGIIAPLNYGDIVIFQYLCTISRCQILVCGHEHAALACQRIQIKRHRGR